MVDAIKEITGVDFWKDMTFEEAVALANENMYQLKNTTQKWDKLSMPSSKNSLKKP